MIQLTAIAAMARNRVIGRENTLPWDAPEDLQHFRTQTKGKILLMGRKTFESLPAPLPGRVHLVISRSCASSNNSALIKSPNGNQTQKVFFLNSVELALQKAEELITKSQWPNEVMVCGGEQIYRLLLGRCQVVHLTELDFQVDGDAFFPELGEKEWQLVEETRKPKMVFRKFCRVQPEAVV